MMQISEERHTLLNELQDACRDYRSGEVRRREMIDQILARTAPRSELRLLLDGGAGGRIIDCMNRLDSLPPEKLATDHLREPAKMVSGAPSSEAEMHLTEAKTS